MNPTEILLQPYQLSPNLILKNKIVMAPMTRCMAQSDGTPTLEMRDYYARRADAGLILTEGTIIRPDGVNYVNISGIFTDAHIRGWEKVTNAVHKNNGKIFLQLWHVGRVSHPNFISGQIPISASATQMHGQIPRARELNYGWSRAVTLTEIQELILAYTQAAKNAIKAGFDGVEIHGANGYLIDQFLHYDTNHREDEYGGAPENMARFALEIVNAIGEAIGYSRVGLRLSPGAFLNEIKTDLRDGAVFKYLLTQLNNLPLAYVHTGNFNDSVIFAELDNLTMTQFIRKYYQGTLIACGAYNFDTGAAGIINNQFNLIALGKQFIANPDLIAKLKNNTAIRDYHTDMLSVLY